MTWWCSAQGLPWDWHWRPYPGVWLFVGAILGCYFLALRAWDHDGDRRRLVSFLAGCALLWVAADWPIGPLGAGYLVSVHTVQYILFALAAPPLLIFGTPPTVRRALVRRQGALTVARLLSRPLVAFAIFNVVMLGTHLPVVVDGLTPSQLGSFAIDMSWFVSGLVFWLPVLGPLPELDPMPYPGRIVYLILNVFIPTVPAAFLTFADYPIYSLYELAPPVGNISSTVDQQLAGLTMKIVGGLIIFATASVLFFRWYAEEERQPGSAGVTR